MTNTEIASIFHDIVDLLRIKGENAFRVRAYENALGAIEELTHSLSELSAGGYDLKAIPGIGKGMAEKIAEIIETERSQTREELLEEFPEGLLRILRVPGIGPKKAALFFRELAVSDLDALELAAGSGRLRTLPGVGEKSEEKILRSIEDFKSISKEFSLTLPLLHGERIISALKGVGVIEAKSAGSVRRWKDSPRDMDILAECEEPAAAIKALASYEHVKEVVSRGETKSTVILDCGLQVDLLTLPKGRMGSALQHFTGSKAHNVTIRERAKRMGLKVSEYGVFSDGDGERIAGDTEESVYRAVGLPWIAPELRENRGEIEAAERGELPEELNTGDILGDLHMHTTASDGSATIEEMARAAMKRGYEYIAITDHSRATAVAGGLDEARLLAHIEEIERVNERIRAEGSAFRILKGTECDILSDGSLDYPEEILKELDWVVGSVHSGFNQTLEHMTARVTSALSTGLVDVLAHPTGRLIGYRAPYAIDMERVMECAAEHGVYMELNCYPERLDLKDIHLRLAREMGILVAINSDSHGTQGFENIEFGIHTARRAWLEKEDVLNTRGLNDFLEILQKRRKRG